MENKVYSAVLNINFDDFDDFEGIGDAKVSDRSRLDILQNVYLNLLMSLGPKIQSVFTNLEVSNNENLHIFYNNIVDNMKKDTETDNNENFIYDFFTVCKGENTEVNIGFGSKSIYVATVSTKKCLEQELISNYIDKNFLTNFLNETARDTIKYSRISKVDVPDVKNLFMYATILSLKNDVYPIAFSPLNRYVRNGDDKEIVYSKIRKIFKSLIETYGE